MASSSSSSFHSTLPTSWKYDVFLSFRGTDTRYTFVDHLYSALIQQGIDTFKDDEELPRGESIRPSLLKAIEDSQIALIVFSENYANSSWCLQELEHIMKCKVERAQIVIPIFYHIDPSEVRKQKRKYGEAFAKHETEKKNVESWRKALFDAGNLSGYVPNGSETLFIKEIVSTILKRLCVAIPSENEDLIGIEDRLEDLKSKLAINSQGVMMVGIWGLGGGGKTTLAYAVYDEISTKFDGCCFVKNVRDESRKNGLEELQKEIISCVLNIKKEEVGDVRMWIKNRLRRKKVLLVLDDVDDANQLEALAGSHNWFNEGSRIIITTRDQHLLNTQKVNVIYNITLLNHNEAMRLFCKHALRLGNHIEDYDSLSKQVVSYAGGLPLALKVIGSFLSDKDKSEWVSTLARLKDNPDGKILEPLKISYDGLQPLVKELFLEIACFFRREEKEAKVILEACGLHPNIGVRELIQKALITVTKEGIFDMHDLIQDMGHYIVREKYPRNPKKHSRVWRREDVVTICVAPMEENHWIEALKLWDIWQERWPSRELNHGNLPRVVANMKELRWFSCYGYPETSLPRNFQSTKLSYLRLYSSHLKQLWEDDKILPNLKVLDLSSSFDLTRTPNFDGFPCLERIRLNNCYGLRHIHPSISYHQTLVSVEMSKCTSLETFPPISGMKKLESLDLSWCSKLCEFPEIKMNMDNMVKLSLKGTRIKVIPSSIGQYCTNLLSLDLRHCQSLESIEGNFHLLKHLKKFYINGCRELKILTEGLFDVNCHLEVLDLFNTSFKNLHLGMNKKFLGFSPSLTRLYLGFYNWINGDISSVLPPVLGFPPSLRRLCLGSCNWINEVDISSVLCELSNLQVLDLRCNDFSRLPCSLLQLSSLKFLNLSGCHNLVELPDLPESIAILQINDHYYRCNNLEIVHLPTNLRWLWRISLPMKSISGDLERKVQSMLQGNAIRDYSISLCFHGFDVCMPTRDFARRTLMLELPRNWYDEFNGFLICIAVGPSNDRNGVITIEDVLGTENEDVLEVCDETPKETSYDMCYIYISFGSLRCTSWWKSKHSTISFSIPGHINLKVELVPGRSKGDSIERVKGTTNSSEFWDKEPIEIIHDSKSCIKIGWCHGDDHMQRLFGYGY